jgi:hypothetical protein
MDGDVHEPWHEAGIPEELPHPVLASPVDRHEENAHGPARPTLQDLEVEERVGRSEGKVTLELEPDHAPEVRAGDGRQLHRLRDHGAPRETDLRAPGSDAGLQELAPNGVRGALVGRDAEGRDKPPGAKAPPEGDNVDLSVSEREADEIAHQATPSNDPRSGKPVAAWRLTTVDLARADRDPPPVSAWPVVIRRTSVGRAARLRSVPFRPGAGRPP